jgi:hypothetical protein
MTSPPPLLLSPEKVALAAAAKRQINRKGRPQRQKGHHRVEDPIELSPCGFNIRKQLVRSGGVPGPKVGESQFARSDNAQEIVGEESSKDIGDQGLSDRRHSNVRRRECGDPKQQGFFFSAE